MVHNINFHGLFIINRPFLFVNGNDWQEGAVKYAPFKVVNGNDTNFFLNS